MPFWTWNVHSGFLGSLVLCLVALRAKAWVLVTIQLLSHNQPYQASSQPDLQQPAYAVNRQYRSSRLDSLRETLESLGNHDSCRASLRLRTAKQSKDPRAKLRNTLHTGSSHRYRPTYTDVHHLHTACCCYATSPISHLPACLDLNT